VPGLSRAQALRRSMLTMIAEAGQSTDAIYHAHPMFWAPFVVVGD